MTEDLLRNDSGATPDSDDVAYVMGMARRTLNCGRVPLLVVIAGSDLRCLEDCAHAGNEQPDDENDADDDAEQNATHNSPPMR